MRTKPRNHRCDVRQIQLVRRDSSPHRQETAWPRGCAVRAGSSHAGSPPSPNLGETHGDRRPPVSRVRPAPTHGDTRRGDAKPRAARRSVVLPRHIPPASHTQPSAGTCRYRGHERHPRRPSPRTLDDEPAPSGRGAAVSRASAVLRPPWGAPSTGRDRWHDRGSRVDPARARPPAHGSAVTAWPPVGLRAGRTAPSERASASWTASRPGRGDRGPRSAGSRDAGGASRTHPDSSSRTGGSPKTPSRGTGAACLR